MGVKVKVQILVLLVGFFLGTTVGAFAMHYFKEKVDAPKTTQHLKIGKVKTKGEGNQSDLNIDQKQDNIQSKKRRVFKRK